METKQVLSDFSGYNASELSIEAGAIVTKLTGNTAFPVASTFVNYLNTAKTNLDAKILAGGNEPSSFQVADIKAAVKETRRQLKVIAALCNWEANGDDVKLQSTGFSLKIKTGKVPNTFNVKLGAMSGEVDCVSPNYVNSAYEWLICNDPLSNNSWSRLAITNNSSVTLKNITPGTKCWIKVIVTKKNATVYESDPHYILVV